MSWIRPLLLYSLYNIADSVSGSDNVFHSSSAIVSAQAAKQARGLPESPCVVLRANVAHAHAFRSAHRDADKGGKKNCVQRMANLRGSICSSSQVSETNADGDRKKTKIEN